MVLLLNVINVDAISFLPGDEIDGTQTGQAPSPVFRREACGTARGTHSRQLRILLNGGHLKFQYWM